MITQDQWVLEAIQGYIIPFIAELQQQCPPWPVVLLERPMSDKFRACSRSEASPQGKGFISNMFLVLKKRQWSETCDQPETIEPICPDGTFQEGIHVFKDLLSPGDWVVKVDLMDAYFMVPIKEKDRLPQIPVQEEPQ